MRAKTRHLLTAFIKSAVATTTLTAFLAASAGPALAGPPDDRKHSDVRGFGYRLTADR